MNRDDEEWHTPWSPNDRCNCALCRRYRICQKLGMKFELMDSVPVDHVSLNETECQHKSWRHRDGHLVCLKCDEILEEVE